MVKITLKYFGMLTIKLGLTEEEIAIATDYINVTQLIKFLKERYGQVIEDYIKQGYQIFIERNGRCINILSLDKYETVLRDGDKILFLYIFAGG